MAITRVHILANELGVNSKAIISKCQAEGLDIKNHMSTIPAGLAATIREWFSEGTHITAVETAAAVDLTKARVKKKKKIEKPQEEPAAATEEKPAGTGETETIQTAVLETEQPPTETQISQIKAPPAAKVKGPEIIIEPPKPLKPPEPVMPAGPRQGKPRPAFRL